MSDHSFSNSTDVERLEAEIIRQRKIIDALMNRVEQGGSGNTDYSLFQTEVLLREQIRLRTEELENALRENERITLELKRSEERFQQLVKQSLVGISMTDGKRFLYANPKFVEITGYTPEELQQMGPLDITPEDIRSQFAMYMNRGFSHKLRGETFLANILKKDQSRVIAEVTVGSPIEMEGEPTLVAVFVDVTDRISAEQKIKALNEQLRKEAIHDPLTGLYNRRYLEESIQRELTRIKRNRQTMSVIMGDLDYFKKVNDTYGHQAGDKVLQFFGKLIVQNTRKSDICCRYGGEEFLVLLPDISYKNACMRAEKLRLKLLDSPVDLNGKTVQLSVSFGVAAFPDDGEDFETLIVAADRALYRAKETGRNRVCCTRDTLVSPIPDA